LTKISDLPDASGLDGTELLPLVQTSTKKATAADVSALAVDNGAARDDLSNTNLNAIIVSGMTAGAGSSSPEQLANRQAIEAALDAIDALGGGAVYLPAGLYLLDDEAAWGDGTDVAQSTKHHRIRLVGAGRGSSDEVSNTEADAVTTLRYNGSTDSAKGVLNLKGPLHSIEIANLELDANGAAGYGLIVNHVTDSVFRNVVVRKWTASSYLLTTRSTTPSGVAYGCGNNSFYDCFAYHPDSNSAGGIKLDSGYSTAGAPSLDSANNDFLGGVYFYGGSSGSYGVHLHGADNNTFRGCQFLPAGGNDGTGKSVYFEQWSGATQWPHENLFSNCGFTQDIGGTSGVGGNTFDPFCSSDGAAIPALAYVRAKTHTGLEYENGARVYRTYPALSVTKNGGSAVNTTSTSYADISGFAGSLTLKSTDKIRVQFTGRLAKATGGTGSVQIAFNGSGQGETLREIGPAGYYQTAAICAEFASPGDGSYNISVQWKSSDANALDVTHATLLVDILR